MQQQDVEQWRFAHSKSKPLGIGTRVRLPDEHDFKRDWPDDYFIVGLNIEANDALNITISRTLSSEGSAGGWGVQDLIAA